MLEREVRANLVYRDFTHIGGGKMPDAKTVAETERSGSGIAEIARRYEISRGLLWNWRSQARRGVLREYFHTSTA